MKVLASLRTSLSALFHRARVEREIAEELREHIRNRADDLERSGLTRAEAERRARIEFGGHEKFKQECREALGTRILETFLQDVRFGLRMLRKSPGFTAIAVLTLALGIGANTAIFSVLESQLWRRLPFPDSERLVDVHVVLRENPRQWDVVTNRVYQAWRAQSHAFLNLGACNYPGARNLTAGGTSERVLVMPVTASLFDTLQVPVERGHGFLQEETTGRDHVAILSHALWQNRFAFDSGIIGKSITIDGQPYVVIGIASPRCALNTLMNQQFMFRSQSILLRRCGAIPT
jgi:hypothetical protein